MSFKEFPDGRHLGYQNKIILAILNLCVTVMPPTKFQSIGLTVWEEMLLEEFQDGRHFGYLNGTILAIFNLHVVSMPPNKFQLNPTYGSGGDVKNVNS